MSDTTISKFLKQTAKQLKKMRETVKRLKHDQEKPQRDKDTPKKPRGNKPEEVIMHLSTGSVAKATLVVIGLVILTNFLGEVADIILIFFVAILFSAALDPTVDALQKRKIPRAISVLGIFLILILVLGFFISQLIPLVASQLIELAKSLSSFASKIGSEDSATFLGETVQSFIRDLLQGIDQQAILAQVKNALEGLSSQLESFAGSTFGAIKQVFNGVFNFVLALILTFFLITGEEGVNDFFISLFPSKHGKYIVEKMDVIKEKVGYWLRGQMILMLLMFTLTLIGLLILGIDYALTLAMMAGIAELIPVAGPILAGIPALLVAFNESPWLVIWVFGLIILLQQIEGNILIPAIMKKAVGLSPIIVILAMLIGFKSIGILGMIIAVPVATTLSIFVRDYAAKEK